MSGPSDDVMPPARFFPRTIRAVFARIVRNGSRAAVRRCARAIVVGTEAAVLAMAAIASLTGTAAVTAVPAHASELPHPAIAQTPLRFAWLRGDGARLWRFDARNPITAGAPAGAGAPLPATLETPLGSVWKLFVYAYLVDRRIPAPDYQCTGGDPDEVYCCMTGGQIDRDHALIQSCGPFFEPARLRLDPAGWRAYWRAAGAPAWLQTLGNLRPARRVAVSDLLAALRAVPREAREETASTLVSVLTSGRGKGSVAHYGGLLRVKTWTMPDPARPGASIGGAAGWLADGTPVWLGGTGGSARVLAEAAPAVAPLLATVAVPDADACVVVDFFARYPVRTVLGARDGVPAPQPGPLDGVFRVGFVNGNWLRIESHGELLLDAPADGATAPRIVGRFGLNDYVARVIEREGDAQEPEAARALAISARSYLVQHAGRERGCFRIDDSSATQRVLAHAPQASARAAADWTDALVLTGAEVRYHHDQAAPGQMSWLAAKAAARDGLGFDAILARNWPQASLTSFQSPLAGDCIPVAGAQAFLRREMPRWTRRLEGEDGYETPPRPAVCEVTAGRPYADAGRNRVYIRGLQSEDDRITLAHEYLHLAFQHHPRGLDETFVEQTARRLIMTGN